MSRRAMTLLEVILAVALLTGVALAATSWMATAARASDRLAGESSWSLAAAATLGLIGESLASGDPMYDDERAQVRDQTLILCTRDADGPAVLEISRREARLVLHRTTKMDRSGAESVLLNHIVAFEVSMDEGPGDVHVLSVLVKSTTGKMLERKWGVR